MKQIGLMKMATLLLPKNVPVDVSQTIETNRQVLENAQEIAAATSALERQLEDTIAAYLFGADRAKRAFFEGAILRTDWFTLTAKLRTILAIGIETGLLVGKASDDYKQTLRRVIRYRNIFAHGRLVHSTGGVNIHYYEGGPRTALLNDDYWTKVEDDFAEAHTLMQDLLVKTGLLYTPKSEGEQA